MVQRRKKQLNHFLLSHSKAFIMLLLMLSAIGIAVLSDNIKAEEEPINLNLLKPAEEHSVDNPYILDSVDDFITLQEYSKNHTCEGMYFRVGDTVTANTFYYSEDEEDDEEGSESGIAYNLSLVGTLILEDESRTVFKGIGQNFSYPFKGDIDFKGITLRMDTSLFCFLGDGANIHQVTLIGKIGTSKITEVMGSNVSVGALASIVYLNDADSETNITNVSVIHANISGGNKSTAGVIGTVVGNKQNVTLNINTVTVDAEIQAEGTAGTNYGTALANGKILTNYPGYSGGMIGDVTSQNQSFYINVNLNGNCKVAGTISNVKMGSGGLIGHVSHRVKVRMNGNFNVLDLLKVTGSHANYYRGYLVGSAAYSLIYATPSTVIQKPTDVNMANCSDLDKDNQIEYATQIFKNTEDSFFDHNITISGKGTEADPYLLTSAEDFQRLSVLLMTQGLYGTWSDGSNYQTWFDVSEAPTRNTIAGIMQYIKGAYYMVTNDVNLGEKGIIRLNRDTSCAFYGCLEGKKGTYANGEYPTITQETDTNQAGVALFIYATGYLKNGVSQERVFKNFNLYGNITARGGISGLIYVITEGNTNYSGYTFENIHMNLNLEANARTSGLITGLVGEAQLHNVTTNNTPVRLNFKDITFNGKLSANSNGAYGGALAGRIYNTSNKTGNPCEVNIENFQFEGNIVNTGQGNCMLSAMIAYVANNTNASDSYMIDGIAVNFVNRLKMNADNITIRNTMFDNSINTNYQETGLLGNTWALEGSLKNIMFENIEYNLGGGYGALFLYRSDAILDFDGITYENITMIKPSSPTNTWISTLMYENYGQVKIRNFSSDNCVMKLNRSYPWVTEGAVNYIWYYNNRTQYYGYLCFEGNDEEGNPYSAVNTYKNKFRYTNLTGTVDYGIYHGARLSYSTEDNMGNSLIHGTGTKTDPFIIDSEAKLDIMAAFYNTIYGRRDYWLKYFADMESTLTEAEKNGRPGLQRSALIQRVGEGYFVFAKSMDLTGYSYYPAIVNNGKYYGFDAYRYYADNGNTNPTEAQIKAVCVNAISTLSGGSSSVSMETANAYKPQIHFAADTIANGAIRTGTWDSPNFYNGQAHRNMHASLFAGITGGIYNGYQKGIVTINNIMLDGVFSSECIGGTGGGALISRTNNYDAVMDATVNISNIDYGDTNIITRTATATTSTYGAGLMIESVIRSEINVNNVRILPGSKVKCDALIGYQAGTNSKTIFRHIDLNAAIDNEHPENEVETQYHADGYGFKYGYFFYYLKEGISIYWYDEGTDVVTPGLLDGEGNRTMANPEVLEHQKYAYKLLAVDVNPLTSNITKGKGTKEDPYIIENIGQLTALGLFTRSKGDYPSYKEWYVGESTENNYVSSDGTLNGYQEYYPESWADNSNLLYRNRDNALDSLSQLMKSYYKLEADLDFSNPPKGYEQAAGDFFGLGIADYPFAGSIDGNGHTITYGDCHSSYINMYGLITYGQGFKVSDLTIKSGDKPLLVNNTGDVYVGMLAACVLGGDNVIDNVTIENNIKLRTNNVGTNVIVGGYVGYLRYGTLTVSGINENTFKNFRIGYSDAMSLPNYNDTYGRNISAIAGAVNGAFIMYRNEDDRVPETRVAIDSKGVITTEGDKRICRVEDLNYYNEYGISASRTRDIYNQSYFDTIGRIKVVPDSGDGALICELENEGQLLLYSIALASGSMSSYNQYNSIIPYCIKASCQKIDEDFAEWMQNEGETDLSDLYNCPYVFRYFDFTALSNGYKDTIFNGCSMLNGFASTVRTSRNYRTTYKLTKDTDVYDMSQFGMSFRGIGDPTSLATNTRPACNFAADFDGNNKTILVDMNVTWDAGLFNNLNTGSSDNSKAPFLIKNFTMSGSIESNCTGHLGSVVGYYTYGYYTFDGINIKDMKLTQKHSSGGHIGGILGYAVWNSGTYLSFKNCMVGDEAATDNKSVQIYTAGANAIGGLVGYSSQMTFNNCGVIHTTLESQKGSVGGMLGITSASYGVNIAAENLKSSDCTLISHSTSGSGVGGIIGNLATPGSTSSYYVALHNVMVRDNEFFGEAANINLGKVVGVHSGLSELTILTLEDQDSEGFTAATTDKIWNCASGSGRCFYIYYNDFKDLEEAEQKYGIDRETEDESGRPITRYAECLEEDVFTKGTGIIDGETGEEIRESIDLIPDTPEMDNTMVKWSSDAGSIDVVLNSLLSSLTNGTGKLNDGINDHISVKVTQMQVSNGVVTAVPNAIPSVSIEYKGGNFIITNNNKYDTVEKYDINGNYVPGTYSLIEVTYGIGNNRYTDTIRIPFFVSNMINVDVYSKLTIGEEYNLDIMRAIERTSSDVLRTTKDSSYSVYVEYMYSSNRLEFEEDVYMYKGFRLYESPDPNIPIGTKLTLLDVTDDNNPKAYYYEVNSVMDFVPLTSFKDENGNNYKERNIRSLKELPEYRTYTTLYVNGRKFLKYNRGVERYFVFVDCSNVEQIGPESQMSPTLMSGVESGQTEFIENKEVFYVKYRCYNTLSTYNGRTISFVDDSVSTTGEINKNSQLSLTASFSDRASDTYWSILREFDYINRDKFLEVAIYLENENGDKIMLPSGTRIKLGSDADSVYEAAKNLSSIYYYKDGANTDGFRLIDIKGNTITDINMSLDFTFAKMEHILEGRYRICLELVRAKNKDFPMGDDTLDLIKSDYIQVTPTAEYGFRLNTDGIDTLAFNKNNPNLVDAAGNLILDFEINANSTLSSALAANKQPVITFQLYKKDEVLGAYLPMASDSVSYPVLTLLQNGTGSNLVLNDASADYMIDKLTGAGEPYVVIPAKLSIPGESDTVNYRLTAAMYVDGERVATDYFIFTVADIK